MTYCSYAGAITEIKNLILPGCNRILGKPEDPAVVLRRLERFNPLLKTAFWRIVGHERPQKTDGTGGLKHLPVTEVPKSQAGALAGLNDRPFYHLGEITFKLSGREQEEPDIETGRPEQP